MAKRAASAYLIWMGEQRGSIVEKFGLQGKKVFEASKKAGELWKAMAPADKKKWEDLAAADKARYEEAVKTLAKRKRAPKTDKDGPKGKRAKKDKDAPKKPMTNAFFAWLADNRKAIAEKYKIEKVTEITKEGAKAWKALAPEVKKPYEHQAAAAKDQYDKDMADYKASRAAGGAEEEDADDDEPGHLAAMAVRVGSAA